eukprot:snap_masked-scaffold313_size211302-processed-gene-0.3 protein:Tk07288 transcript:snap_masked-scaffold313_size211302-processed-gene-0.3-mRNA-1 annotation:"hypothetical protein LOTGIDRAFT_214616"
MSSEQDNNEELLKLTSEVLPREIAGKRTHEPRLEGVDEDDNESCNGFCVYTLMTLSMFIVVITFPFSLCIVINTVQEYERAVIFRLGRLKKRGAVGPGLFFIIPCVDSIKIVDLRTISFNVPPQEVLSKDSVTVTVDAVVYYKIHNPMGAVCNVADYNMSTRLLAATSLRTILGTKNLSEILSEREQISHALLDTLESATEDWGITVSGAECKLLPTVYYGFPFQVERVEVKDAVLPKQLQRAMAAEAEATREARAKAIAAEGEKKAARALKEASDIMSESSSALQLRYLQTLSHISAEKNSTVIFPVPIDVISHFMPEVVPPLLHQCPKCGHL